MQTTLSSASVPVVTESTLKQRRDAAEEDLRNIEKQIFDMETAYLGDFFICYSSKFSLQRTLHIMVTSSKDGIISLLLNPRLLHRGKTLKLQLLIESFRIHRLLLQMLDLYRCYHFQLIVV